MKISKRVAAATIAAAVLAGIAVVPAQAADASTITIWTDKQRQNSTKDTIAKWATDNGVTIKWVIKDFGAQQLRDTFKAAVQAGNDADLLIGPHDWTGDLVASGQIGTVALGTAAATLNAGAKAGFASAGQQYGLPLYQENIALVRNVHVMPKASTKLADYIKKGLEVQSWDPNGDPYHYNVFLSSFGISEYKRDKAGAWTTTPNLGGANGAKYAKWLATTGKKLKGAKSSWNQLICALQTGAVAGWVTGPWSTNTDNLFKDNSVCPGYALKPTDIAVDVIPSAGGKTASQFLGANGVFKSVKVASAANALNVGKLIAYLGTKAAQVDFYNAGGVVPANKDAQAEALAYNPILKGFAKAGTNAIAMPSFAFQDAVFQAIGKTERNIVLGKSKNPTADWAAMAKAVAGLTK